MGRSVACIQPPVQPLPLWLRPRSEARLNTLSPTGAGALTASTKAGWAPVDAQ